MPPPKLRKSTKSTAFPVSRPLQPRQKSCIINRLPDEILREIFAFAFENAATPISFFLVNRHWNEVASGLSLLRSFLFLGEPEDRADLRISEYQKPIFCTTSDQLFQALDRIANAEFELHLRKIPDNLDLEAPPFSTRCRTLSIRLGPEVGGDSFCLPNMGALRELSLGIWPPHFDLSLDENSLLFERLEAGAPFLTTLVIEGFFPRSLLKRDALLGRLTEVELSMCTESLTFEDSATLCSKLSNVEAFTWDFYPPLPETPFYTPVSTKTLNLFDIAQIRAQDYKNVVTLVVSYTGVPYTYPNNPLQFPVLQKLMMYGSWYQLPLIHAPLLQQLVLGNSDQNEEEINEQLALIQLKPKVVYLSSRMSDASLILLLNGIWSEIEELHRTYVLSNDVPGVTLAQAFAGNANLRPPCPRMWCLTMRIRSSEAPDPILVRRSVQTLRQIVKSRKRRGCISLTRVRCGWIEEGRNDNSGEEEEPTEDPEESPRAWIDVL